MNILRYTAIALFLTALIACDDNAQSNFQFEDTNVSFDIDESRFTPSVGENNRMLKVPVILAGIPGAYSVSVTIVTDTVGKENPAIEGVDFTIRKKTLTFDEGCGIQYLEVRTIDNEIKNVEKTFDLIIESSSRPLKPNTANRITVSITDDEHPLKDYLGTYQAKGIDVFTGKDEAFLLRITADNDDETMVMMEGFPVMSKDKIKLRLDIATGICSIPAGQLMTKSQNVYNHVQLCKCFRREDGYLGYDFTDIPGTISENGTVFTFSEWVGAVILDEGPDFGAAFFTYKALTLTKTGR